MQLTGEKGWEDDEKVLKRLDELRPYYAGDGYSFGETSKRGVRIRLTDRAGRSKVYPSKKLASLALGFHERKLTYLMSKPDFCGYCLGYKVEELRS